MDSQELGEPLRSRLLAEFLGTASIVATVLGAGFMTQQLGVDGGLGLLMIASAVAAVLFVAISIFGQFSGAHFNPIVTLSFFALQKFDLKETSSYVVSQLAGAIFGALAASLMFEKALVVSSVDRINSGSFIGEIIASAGLVLLILQLVNLNPLNLVAPAVALWILAGHLFTSSTSFANPAVSFGRVLSSAPSGIDLHSAVWFVFAQLLGMAIALGLFTQFRKVEV